MASESGNFICILKAEYQPVSGDNDILAISNLGALRLGLEALQKEDAQDWVNANRLWKMAKELLSDEASDDIGPQAEATVQVEDIFNVAQIGCTNDAWGGYYP